MKIKKPYLFKMLTIDPGFSGGTNDGTGWAYWSGNKIPVTGLIKENRKKKSILSMEERMGYLFSKFLSVLRIYKPKIIYIESMGVWAMNPISLSSATSGKLMNLQALVGGYCASAFTMDINFKMLLPQKWKGQMGKDVVSKRIIRINKISYPNHISDAVGMGFSLSGHL